jgi:hypothetical protein
MLASMPGLESPFFAWNAAAVAMNLMVQLRRRAPVPNATVHPGHGLRGPAVSWKKPAGDGLAKKSLPFDLVITYLITARFS